ncbi:hypothetical protein Q9251_06215 [Alkalihalobacillus macyae]|uniref:hypothetical protein n=1 Tax=Guptibacillus hwajinpoensis TaxID=208199 RepID=UPI00273B83BA|nr:hypothetical protein [Alkalihalobacillus macyae]MDP4550472.1 hypothetical protein [Alkalihalobacillus macyae]
MHHNLIRNERGSSLVLVLLVTLVFTVLGLSLLSATVNGTKRTELREDDVQATYVAEKGVDEIVQSIQTDLRRGLGTSGLTIASFNDFINSTINLHKSTTALNHQTGTSVAKVVSSSVATNVLRRVIVVESTGNVNGETETIRKTLEIGPDSVPDVLRYAIGTYTICSKNPSCDVKGEGNLFLHGAVAIQGDLKVDGDLITTNQGYAKYGNHDYWIDTYLPTIKSISDPTSKAKMVLGGEIINFTNEPPYKSHIDRMNFNANHYNAVEPEQAFLGNDYPIIENREPIRDPVVISNNESLYKYTYNDNAINGEPISKKSLSATSYSPLQASIANANMPNENVYPYFLYRYIRGNNTYEQVYNFSNTILSENNIFKRFSTEGSLSITGNPNSYSSTSSKNGIYVGRDLVIGNPDLLTNNRNNTNTYDKLKVSGPFFVGNDLTIEGANVEFNALIYVKGDVDIQYSVLKGLNENGKTGSLIVFAEGDIQISNNSLYDDTPSYIRGYFYSGGQFEMYGVGSNVNIDGGISARKIVLNAIKGKSKASNPNSNQYVQYGDGYFQQKSHQLNEPSRLTVKYNPTIIKTYSDLKTEEPIIKNIAEPVPIERTKK